MSSPELAAEAINEQSPPSHGVVDVENLPPLYEDLSFWGMNLTQFLGAFNDNLFKQVVLLLSIAAVKADGGEAVSEDDQWLPMLVFAAPFLAFTGFAGYLSDKFSKRIIIILCKVAEIVVMALGGLGFYLYTQSGSLTFAYTVLFLMGAQSAFFGPGKYGILPEMLRERDLPRANGFMLMLTFLAIIFGTVVAGQLLGDGRLWLASSACVVIAVIGTLTSLFVRRVPAANPNLKFEPSAITVPPDMREMLAGDRPLLAALLVSSIFWLLAGLVPLAVNAVGKLELQIGDAATSRLAGLIGVGIAIGCAIGGLVSKGRIDFRLLRIGVIGMCACLLIAGIPGGGDAVGVKDAEGNFVDLPGIGESRQWLGYTGSIPIMLLLGVFTGLFAVPLQVFMQSRPPEDKKGRMIAVMNQANWVGVLLSAGTYYVLSRTVEYAGWPRSTMFLFIAALTLPIAIFYHPKHDQPAST
jgi:acyl-[acyl-carrier-protein]-phospholipid O-acyltransferase/long-chain-fatty-acid--[acyl-carrier-protein] ligase